MCSEKRPETHGAVYIHVGPGAEIIGLYLQTNDVALGIQRLRFLLGSGVSSGAVLSSLKGLLSN